MHRGRQGKRWRGLGIRLLVCCLAFVVPGQRRCAWAAESTGPSLPLRTIDAVRRLPGNVAGRGLPVHLRAVVAFYDGTIGLKLATFFIHDRTGGIFVLIPAHTELPIHEGTLLDIVGVTQQGSFAPVVDKVQIRVLGQSHMPREAPLLPLSRLMDGSFDSQWVQVEGVVHSVRPQNQNMVMRIATEGGIVAATTIREPGVDYFKLIDSRIRAHAVVASSFNKRRQLAGVHLFIASMGDIQVLKHGPVDPFALPPRSISQLSLFEPGKGVADQVHLRGVVTLQRLGQMVCLQDQTGGSCVETSDLTPIPVGTVVDAVGFRALGTTTPKLTDGIFRVAGKMLQPSPATLVSSSEALLGLHVGELIQIDGEIVGLNSDPLEPSAAISSGGLVFSASLPDSSAAADLSQWRRGSRVRVRGICTGIAGSKVTDERQGTTRFEGFRILMRTPGDLTVIKKPSWWTPVHTISVLSAALVTMLAALGWALWLHRRVQLQTGVIRESEERYRHLAYHDPLTGLANRAMLHLRLNEALKQAHSTKGGLGLLLLDLDGFKQVNDTMGHDAGDIVLQTVADRLKQIIREPDTVARLGGDEFVILLPNLRNVEDACSCAQRVLAGFAKPLHIGIESASLRCSIGISVLDPMADTMQSFFKRADTAMYEAKMSGKNQFRLSLHQPRTAPPKTTRPSGVLPAVDLLTGAIG